VIRRDQARTIVKGMTVTTHHHPVAHRIVWIAALWAGTYALVALVWTVTGADFPFGTNLHDPASPLRGLTPGVGAPLFAAILSVTTLALVTMAAPSATRLRGASRAALASWTAVVATALVAVVPTASVLAILGYAPGIIVGAPFGWPADLDYGLIFNWPVANQFWCLGGGTLIGAATVAFLRRTRGACVRCGRVPDREPGRRLDRWAGWAVGVAVTVPLLYAATRSAWVFDIPFATNRADLNELRANGGQWAGLALASFAIVGAGLTLGLIRPWGEVFPRWLPGIRGRRVPVTLAVIPATIVSLALVSAGLDVLTSDLGLTALRRRDGYVLPMTLWPLWGAVLGLATYAYTVRRRGTCPACGGERGRSSVTKISTRVSGAITLRPTTREHADSGDDRAASRDQCMRRGHFTHAVEVAGEAS